MSRMILDETINLAGRRLLCLRGQNRVLPKRIKTRKGPLSRLSSDEQPCGPLFFVRFWGSRSRFRFQKIVSRSEKSFLKRDRLAFFTVFLNQNVSRLYWLRFSYREGENRRVSFAENCCTQRPVKSHVDK